MKNNTRDVLMTLIWAVAITTIVSMLFLMMAWVLSPTTWTFKIEMDNNTKEAIQSINYTQTDYTIYQNDDCGYTEQGYCCFMNLGEQTENRSELVCSRLSYAKGKLNESAGREKQ